MIYVPRSHNSVSPVREYADKHDGAPFYIIGQDYETGQAVPVTGGQLMLK